MFVWIQFTRIAFCCLDCGVTRETSIASCVTSRQYFFQMALFKVPGRIFKWVLFWRNFQWWVSLICYAPFLFLSNSRFWTEEETWEGGLNFEFCCISRKCHIQTILLKMRLRCTNFGEKFTNFINMSHLSSYTKII